jgi:hypothetical protein
MQVGIAALALDSSGVPPGRTCVPHPDKVAGKPDVAQPRISLAAEGTRHRQSKPAQDL